MRYFQVRWGIWLFAGLCLIVALIWPAADLWRAWHTPVAAQITMLPAHPVAGRPLRFSVTLSGDARTVAREAPLVLVTDMVGMPMGQRTLEAQATQDPRYDVPLQFSMAGTWWVNLQLILPDHAPWRQRVLVTVQAGGA